MGDGRIFLKTRRDVSFHKVLWNEPTFGRIHLSGQYLEHARQGAAKTPPPPWPKFSPISERQHFVPYQLTDGVIGVTNESADA